MNLCEVLISVIWWSEVSTFCETLWKITNWYSAYLKSLCMTCYRSEFRLLKGPACFAARRQARDGLKNSVQFYSLELQNVRVVPWSRQTTIIEFNGMPTWNFNYSHSLPSGVGRPVRLSICFWRASSSASIRSELSCSPFASFSSTIRASNCFSFSFNLASISPTYVRWLSVRSRYTPPDE